MNTIPAREIKRRGIRAIDDLIERGPLHVIRNDEPTYVVLTEAHYWDLMDDADEPYVDRVRAGAQAIADGDVRRGTVRDLLADIDSAG